MNDDSFVLTSWVNALLTGLKNDGCDISKILDHAQVSAETLERGYCSLSILSNVFDSAQELYGDYVGVSSNKGVTPSSFRSLSIAILTSENLYEGFSLLAKHNETITNVIDFMVDQEDGGRFGFTLKPGYEIKLPLVAAVLGRAMRTAGFIQPCAHLLQKVTLAFPKPDNSNVYECYFDAPIKWGSDINAIFFDESIYLSSSAHADKALCENAENSWLDEVSHFTDMSFIKRVESYVKANIGERRLTLQHAAEHFDMSVRTFQRRLDQENESFTDIIMHIRQNESKAYLLKAEVSITNTAYSLGFTDAGSFSRAFKTWFGMSPEQYRKDYQASC